MTVIYYTSPYFLDISIEVINILKKHVQLHVLIEVTNRSKKANILDVKTLPANKPLVPVKELLEPSDYKYIEPYLDGVASANFIIHSHDTGVSFSTLRTNYKVWRYIRKFKPDIIHFETFSLRTAGFFPYMGIFRKTFLAIHDPVFHSGENNWKNSLPRKLFFKMPFRKQLLFYSQFALQQFVDHNKKDKLPKLVIKMNPYSYYSAFGKEGAGTRKHILFFGRISPYKGIDILLESVPAVVEKHPDALFVIAGRSAKTFTFNEEIVNRYKDNITIINRYIPNEELATFIRNAKFVVCPYTDATQSGVLMTAYAFDAPVVATAVGAFPEYIQDNVTGMLVHNRNSVELAEKINAALENYEQMNRNIKEKFDNASWEINRPAILEAYGYTEK